MHKINKQQLTVAAIAALVLVLTIVSLTSRSNFTYRDTTDYAALKKQQQTEYEKQLREYTKQLEAVDGDPVASRQIMQSLVSYDDVRAEVDKALNVKQKIVLPAVADSQIHIKKTATHQDAVDYFTAWDERIRAFNDSVIQDVRDGYNNNSSLSNARAINKTEQFLDDLYNMPVPNDPDIIAFHKGEIGLKEVHVNQLKLAENFATLSTDAPWPELYQDTMRTNQILYADKDRVLRINKAYALNLDTKMLGFSDGFSDWLQSTLGTPVAHAAVPVITVPGSVINTIVDLPRWAQWSLEETLGIAFNQLMVAQLRQWLDKLTKNYTIANFLYYSDALVNAQYTNDYLKKYVTNDSDKNIVKGLITQINCGKLDLAKLKPLLQTKALEYLGFDPSKDLDLSSPNFYAQVNRAGHLMSDPDGAFVFYKSLAQVVENEAKSTAKTELQSGGSKAARTDTGSLAIKLPAGTTLNAALANMINALDVGNSQSLSPSGKLAAALFSDLINTFIFKGATVYKEQAVCLALPQVSPITQAAPPQAASTPQAQLPNNQQIQACSQDLASCDFFGGNSGTGINPRGTPAADSGIFTMDKTLYFVGDKPQFSLEGAPANSSVALQDIPKGSVPPSSSQIKFESQQTDPSGNWAATYSQPFTCDQLGSWTMNLLIGGQTYTFEYTVEDNPAQPSCQAKPSIPIR